VKQRKIKALLFLFLTVSAAAFAEAGLAIRYFDKRIYHLAEDPVLVQITLSNPGPAAYRFRLAEDRAFSIDFDVRTMTNLAVEPAQILVRRRSTSQQVFFREIAVESGESFSFVEDLRNFVDITQSGSYVVQARLYPGLLQTASGPADFAEKPLESNRLSLNVRPSSLFFSAGGIPVAMDVETNAILAREKLPPDEVVRYMLTARQKSQWEKFFLYLDIESMIRRDAQRSRQWIAESEEGRRRMEARYRSELEAERIDGDIATIPMDFQIERTTYGASEGTVSALEKFKVGSYIERKRYTYYLELRDDIWTVVDYTVLNLGTE
jgi:hypothetical protein